MKRPPLRQASPEERIAAVANNLTEEMFYGKLKRPPEFADYRDAVRPYMAREILLARISEAKTLRRTDRVVALESQLARHDFEFFRDV